MADKVKFVKTELSTYQELSGAHDAGTIYFLTDGGGLYVGDKPIVDTNNITANIDFLSSQISSNTELLTILTGDGVSSISELILREVATIVDNAPSAFDTLKEIADWICSDTSGAVALINQVVQTENNILALSGGLSDLTGDLSGISVGLTGDIAYISSTIYNDYAAKSYVNSISAALSTGVNSTINSVSSALNSQLTDITGNYVTKTEVDAVSTLLSNEITALDSRIEKYEDVITVDNGIVQISALSVSTISGVNSDFVVSKVSAENVSIQSTSALAFTTEGTTLAEILNELSADASAHVQLSTYNSQITTLSSAVNALNDHQEEYESAISIRDDGIVEISSLSVANISSTNAEFTATSVYTDNLQIKDLSTVTIADRNNQTLEAILSALSAELSSAIITNDLTWQELP